MSIFNSLVAAVSNISTTAAAKATQATYTTTSYGNKVYRLDGTLDLDVINSSLARLHSDLCEFRFSLSMSKQQTMHDEIAILQTLKATALIQAQYTGFSKQALIEAHNRLIDANGSMHVIATLKDLISRKEKKFKKITTDANGTTDTEATLVNAFQVVSKAKKRDLNQAANRYAKTIVAKANIENSTVVRDNNQSYIVNFEHLVTTMEATGTEFTFAQFKTLKQGKLNIGIPSNAFSKELRSDIRGYLAWASKNGHATNC